MPRKRAAKNVSSYQEDSDSESDTPKKSYKSPKVRKNQFKEQTQSKPIEEIITLLSNESDSCVHFFDLESHDIFPNIFRHFRLSDFLNFSLVSKKCFEIVAPEIERRSKITFKSRGFFRKEELEIQQFQRNYNEIELENDNKKQLLLKMEAINNFKIFNLKRLSLNIDSFENKWSFFKKLKETGKFESFSFTFRDSFSLQNYETCVPYISQITKFHCKNFNNLYEMYKLCNHLNIRELVLECSFREPKDVTVPLPHLRILRISTSDYSIKIIRAILKGSPNLLTKLVLRYFADETAIKEILELNANTLENIEICYVRTSFMNLLPAQPKVLKFCSDSSASLRCSTNFNCLLDGQRNLESLTLEFINLDGKVLDEIIKNNGLLELTLIHCDFDFKALQTKYIPIFSRLKKLVFQGSFAVFEMFAKYLKNVTTLLIDSVKKGKTAKFKSNIEFPKLEKVMFRGSGRGVLPVFRNSVSASNIKFIDIQYSNKLFIDLNSLGEFNNSVRILKVRNWLSVPEVTYILKNYVDLEELYFRTTDFHGSKGSIQKLYDLRKEKLKYVNITIYDWNRAFNEFKEALSTTCSGATVKGSCKGTCVVVEIFFDNPVIINIEKSFRKHSDEP